MIRHSHKLKDNQTAGFPSKFIFFDTETTTTDIGDNLLEHHLRLGAALYWERRFGRGKDTLVWCHFTSIDQFWDFVEKHTRSRDRLFIIAHNLSFDMGIVKGFKQLEERGFQVVKMIFDYRKNIWKFRRDTTTLVFLDNMNYFATSLEKLGESVGLRKLKQPPFSASDKVWWKYNKRDVEVLYHTWQHWLTFLTDNDLGTFGLTIASQSFNAYRHRFMSEKIYIHTSKRAIGIERASYRGGRVECYHIGELPLRDYYVVDVNSMYAYMLKTYYYPTNLISTGKKASLRFISRMLDKYCVSAEVVVNTPEPCYGIKYEGRLVFPIGQFTATLNSCELSYGIDRGYILDVLNFAIYEKGLIFGDYVDFFYSKRLEFAQAGNDSYSYLCKLMLNSLYGKFGQQIEEWSSVGYDPTRLYDYWTEWDVETKTLHTFRCLNHWVEEKVGSVEGYNSLVAIPAEATAYARMYLWKLITLATLEHTFYCDTDSLIVDKFGLANLREFISPSEIGHLKIEGKARKLILYGLKDYRFGDKVVIKGIPKQAVKLADDVYEVYQSLGIKSGLHTKELNKVIWRKMQKHLKRDYKKGITMSDGSVTPLILLVSEGYNWLDEEKMLEVYGELAHYGKKYLDELTKPKDFFVKTTGEPMADYSHQDKLAAKSEDLDKRRSGEMPYQRGKY